MKKLILGLLALGLVGALAPSASALLTVSAGVGAAPTGVSYANLDSLPLGNGGGTDNGITVAFLTGDGAVVTGPSGIAAPPFVSGGNGGPFGNPDGVDTSPYVTTGIGSVKLSFASLQQYVGFLWGSVDLYNTLQFFNGATLVGTVTGADVNAGADGNQGVNGTFYVNINSTLQFDSIIASSTSYAFEIDNIAFDESPQNPLVPEPASLALLSLGLTGLGIVRRKRAARA